MKHKLNLLPVMIVTTFVIGGIIAVQKTHAAIVETVHNRQFIVQDEFVEVKESKGTSITQDGYQIPTGEFETFTIFSPVEGQNDIEQKKQATIDSISVTDKYGARLNFFTEQTDSQNLLIKVPITTSITRTENSEIFLKYNSYGLVIESGAIKDVYIPGIPEDYKFEENNVKRTILTNVKIPSTEPEVNFISPKYDFVLKGDSREISIPEKDLLGQTVWIQLGTKQYFSFEIKQRVPKTSGFPFALNTLFVPVPRNVESGPVTQQVYFTYISEDPNKVSLDKDNNLIFEFKSSSSGEKEVVIKGYAELSQNGNFDITDSGSIFDIGEDMLEEIQPGKYWEVDSDLILETASEIKGEETDVYRITQKTFDYVINKIDYSFVKKYGLNERQGALATLNGGAAVCMEYSDLFITLLRAQGIPARAAFGYGYGALDYLSQDERDINHQWAEVYLPKQDTWVSIDTTWGDFGSQILGGDLNHFYSHVASKDPETPSTAEISYFGELAEIPEREMVINIEENLNEFTNQQSRTQEDLLEEFKAKEGVAKIQSSIGFQIDILDNNIENFFRNNLSITSGFLIGFFKLLMLLCPFILILSLTLLPKLLNKKNLKTEVK